MHIIYYIFFLFQLTHDFWLHSDKDEVVLKEWEVESPHHYENNQHISQVGQHSKFCLKLK